MITNFGLFFDDLYDMGFGHISRLVALAQELRQRDLDYCFHGNGEMNSSSREFIEKSGLRSNCHHDQKPDVSILDTYNPEFIRNFSPTQFRVLLVDEMSPSVFANAYLVASPILTWTPPMKDSRVLAFQNSPILRKEIVTGALGSSKIERNEGLLVILGGVSIDFFEKIIHQLRYAAQDIWPESPLSVVCYSSDQIAAAEASNFTIVYPSTDILKLTSRFCAVISAAGVMAWELAALRIPGFTIAVVENQEFQVRYLKENNFRDGINATSLNFNDLIREEILKLKTQNSEVKICPDLDGSRKAIDFILDAFSR